MAMPRGQEEYNIYSNKIVAFGMSHTDDEMEKALCNDVYDKLFDVKEHNEIAEKLSETGFDKAIIMKQLFPTPEKEDWEIGEAYAQVYLESNMNSDIPWGITRDIKKPSSSLPGADIVGLYKMSNNVCFLFGEIKTSSQEKYPPSVMYGEHGLKKQLEDLCEDKEITDALVKYLAYRLKDSEKWKDFQNAYMRYMQSSGENVHIIGLLLRDVKPSEEDLKTRVKKLEKFVVNGRTIELVGLYLPIQSITKFVGIINAENERRSVSYD